MDWEKAKTRLDKAVWTEDPLRFAKPVLCADIRAALARVEELEAQLAHLRSEEPCPRCGYGVTGDCFGCKLKASEAKLVEVGRICGMSVTEDPLMAVRRVADQHDRVMAQRDTAEAKLREKDERIEDLIEGGVALQAKLAQCVEAASDVAEGACSFKDSRVSYEEWQINVGSMERLRAAIAGEATARGWLIESTLSHGGGPRWWQGKQPGTEEQWTGSHTAAIRFARREDAEACRLTLGDAHVSKVTEHVWL